MLLFCLFDPHLCDLNNHVVAIIVFGCPGSSRIHLTNNKAEIHKKSEMSRHVYSEVIETIKKCCNYTKFITEEAFSTYMLGRCLDSAGLSMKVLMKSAEDNKWSNETLTLRITELINKRVKFSPAIYKLMVITLNDMRSNMVKSVRSEVEGETSRENKPALILILRSP